MTRQEELVALLERRRALTHGRSLALVPALSVKTLQVVQSRIEEIARELDAESRQMIDPETGAVYDPQFVEQMDHELDALFGRVHGGEA